MAGDRETGSAAMSRPLPHHDAWSDSEPPPAVSARDGTARATQPQQDVGDAGTRSSPAGGGEGDYGTAAAPPGGAAPAPAPRLLPGSPLKWTLAELTLVLGCVAAAGAPHVWADAAAELARRVAAAYTRPPDAAALAAALAFFAPPVLAVGLRGGALRPPRAPAARDAAKGAVLTFFAPSLYEETVFRVLLLPTPDPGAPLYAGWCDASVWVALAAFVAYHMDAGHSAPPQRAFFASAFGVFAEVMMGLACTGAYLLSGGSVWTPVLLHWVSVWVWLFILGGVETLFPPESGLLGAGAAPAPPTGGAAAESPPQRPAGNGGRAPAVYG